MLARTVTRAFERLGIRGAPTILRQLAKLPSNRHRIANVRLHSGQLIWFPAYDHYWCRALWAGATYEADVEWAFRALGAGRTLIDCGANIGYWSVRAPEFGFTRVIAVEANEELLPILRQNVTQVDGTVYHAAVHSTSGKSMFLDVGLGHAPASLGEAGMPVTSICLNDIARDFASPVVKLDVEGAEIEAIKGASELDADFVFEDWSGAGMPVTAYLLDEGYNIYGFSGRVERIGSVEEALDFNARTTSRYAPSNFVGTRRTLTG